MQNWLEKKVINICRIFFFYGKLNRHIITYSIVTTHLKIVTGAAQTKIKKITQIITASLMLSNTVDLRTKQAGGL